MRVILFGASAMVGQGVLRKCLRADDVEQVLVVSRTPLGQEHAKLRAAQLRVANAIIDWHKAATTLSALSGEILPAYGVELR